MKFTNARCVVCGQDIFPPDWAVFYQVRGGHPQTIKLGGEQPWTGVRAVCGACLAFLVDATLERVPPTEPS